MKFEVPGVFPAKLYESIIWPAAVYRSPADAVFLDFAIFFFETSCSYCSLFVAFQVYSCVSARNWISSVVGSDSFILASVDDEMNGF